MSKAITWVFGAILLASFAVWVYAYGFVDRVEQDLWDDQTISDQAAAICTEATDDIAAMPNALEASGGVERAAQIRAATTRLETMVDELDDLQPTTENDKTMHEGWIADWHTVISDRLAYADAIEVDENAQYLQTNIGIERLDKRLTRFADTNGMYACKAPTDV